MIELTEYAIDVCFQFCENMKILDIKISSNNARAKISEIA